MRRLFMTCSLVSFVLFLLIVVAWNAAVSDYSIDRWRVLPSADTPRLHGWGMDAEGFSFESFRRQQPPVAGPTLVAAESYTTESDGVTTFHHFVGRNPQIGVWEQQWPHTDRQLIRFRLIREPEFADAPESTLAAFVSGFTGHTSARRLLVGTYSRFIVPFWAPLALTAVLPLLFSVQFLIRRVRSGFRH